MRPALRQLVRDDVLEPRVMQPLVGNWLAREKELRALAAARPDAQAGWALLTGLLQGVGRCGEASEIIVRAWKRGAESGARP